MRRTVLCALFVLRIAGAATIQGTALENLSGRPLARAVVKLTAVGPKGGADSIETAANTTGQFRFSNLGPGAYAAERCTHRVRHPSVRSKRLEKRRKWLDGEGLHRRLRPERDSLPPGYWEFSVTPPAGMYVAFIKASEVSDYSSPPNCS